MKTIEVKMDVRVVVQISVDNGEEAEKLAVQFVADELRHSPLSHRGTEVVSMREVDGGGL